MITSQGTVAPQDISIDPTKVTPDQQADSVAKAMAAEKGEAMTKSPEKQIDDAARAAVDKAAKEELLKKAAEVMDATDAENMKAFIPHLDAIGEELQIEMKLASELQFVSKLTGKVLGTIRTK